MEQRPQHGLISSFSTPIAARRSLPATFIDRVPSRFKTSTRDSFRKSRCSRWITSSADGRRRKRSISPTAGSSTKSTSQAADYGDGTASEHGGGGYQVPSEGHAASRVAGIWTDTRLHSPLSR